MSSAILCIVDMLACTRQLEPFTQMQPTERVGFIIRQDNVDNNHYFEFFFKH